MCVWIRQDTVTVLCDDMIVLVMGLVCGHLCHQYLHHPFNEAPVCCYSLLYRLREVGWEEGVGCGVGGLLAAHYINALVP